MRFGLICCLVGLCFVSLSTAQEAHASIRKPLNIPAENLSDALRTLAKDRQFEVLYRAEAVRDIHTDGAVGEYSNEEALKQLLKGTGLAYKYLDANTVTVFAAPSQAAAAASSDQSQTTNNDRGTGKRNSQDFRLAQVGQANSGPQIASDATPKKDEQISEIVVTGTHIHGAEPVSRVSVFTRQDLDLAGASNLKDFFQTLPQNFASESESTAGAVVGRDPAGNTVDATGINLRGFGTSATLVLLNGQRLAPGNSLGNIVDISMIPVSAIERVEIIADGASAIYGSDAVGGVVNVILRRSFEGAETRLNYGSDSHGNRQQYQASQTLGHDWGSGSGLITYDFDDESPLYASDRSFTDTAPEPFTLLPKTKRNSVFTTAQQDLGTWQLFGTGSFSNRSGYNYSTETGLFSEKATYNIDVYNASLGVRTDVSADSKLELTSDYSRSDSHSLDFYNAGDTGSIGPPFISLRDVTSIASVDAKLDGRLLTLAAGKALYAIGGQFRRESYTNDDMMISTNYFSTSRRVGAGFAEIHVPLVASGGLDGVPAQLELSMADRFEHYSDFGSTNNPEIGLLWRPSPEIRVRGSYSTSFVAPTLSDLNPIPSTVLGISSDYSEQNGLYGPNSPNVIIDEGGNPNLAAQKSRNWTIGFEFKSLEGSGASAYVDYYNLSYRDQINSIDALGFNNLVFSPQILQDGNILGPQIINRNPSPALVQQLISEPTYIGYGTFSPTAGTTVIDTRDQNLSIAKTDGVDFGLTYKARAPTVDWQVGVDGTYILKFEDQVTPAAPTVSFLNLAYNPVNLKLRASGLIHWEALTAAAFVNYTNSYHSLNTGTSVPVAAWTTVDMTLNYDLSSVGPLGKTTITVGARNLLDRPPPFVANYNGFPLNYDGVNANALGRFLHIQLVAHW